MVYSNNMGALHTYGSPPITSIVDQNRHDIFARDDYQEVVMHENVTDQRLLLPSSTIHWSNEFSNLLEVLPILLLKHLVVLAIKTRDKFICPATLGGVPLVARISRKNGGAFYPDIEGGSKRTHWRRKTLWQWPPSGNFGSNIPYSPSVEALEGEK